VLLLAILIIVLAFAVAGLMGAPYVPILKRDSDALLALAELKPGQTLVDLGSGDGRLLAAAARKGIRCIGYEINPFMVLISKIVCWNSRSLVSIHFRNLWTAPLPPADAIYVFLMPKFMSRLNIKLTAEIHKPTAVISYAFKIPGPKMVKHNTNTYVYEYGQPTSTRH
jgi:SAM-dependent methyltransferase